MKTLLYVQASPRGAESKSIEVADSYLAKLVEKQPTLSVDVIRLWDEDLPEFGETEANLKTKIMKGHKPEGDEVAIWETISRIARRFMSADRYLFAVPMWNGGIPYRLKQYIDIVHQPGLTWGINPQTGFFGLLKDKHATIVLTSGAYRPGAPIGFGQDYQSTYIRDWLNQTGIEIVDAICFQPTLLTPVPQEGLARAKDAALTLAEQHATSLTV